MFTNTELQRTLTEDRGRRLRADLRAERAKRRAGRTEARAERHRS